MGKSFDYTLVAAVLYIRVLGNDTERRGIQLSEDEYHVTVNESTAAGTRLLTLSARSTSGSHLARRIFYNIIAGNDDACFHINTSTGKSLYLQFIITIIIIVVVVVFVVFLLLLLY